ncbi:Hint domain-containing protein [Palleronia pontilimi]|uniref:Hint domain-containing protein n=1 Tax=Palleronia pontilimi TaxID=1964209 RepID=UPI0022A8ACEE|nr:Hint domain-containing protein [Palleronia pontilimi]
MTATTNINLIYFGKFASTDVHEGDYKSEHASLLNAKTADFTTLKIVAVTTTDPQHDGVINDDECDAHDRFTYTLNGVTTKATTDSTMTFQATLTLADGSTLTEEVLVVQATNGDVFISDLLNGGTIDNLKISSITLDHATGTNFRGWYSNQSVDGSSIVAPAQLDGIVEGTAGDDVIDAAYTGDPEGDRIDSGDAIGGVFGADGSDDDLVLAGAGNDLVDAGTGNDKVLGGAGNDTLLGGDGDDTLLGDADLEQSTVLGERALFDWEKGPGFGDRRDVPNFTQDTGAVKVSFTTTRLKDSDGDSQHRYETTHQNTSDLDAVVSEGSSFNSELEDQGDKYRYDFAFDAPVADVEFRVNDIDGGGRVTITAMGPDGPVTVTLTPGSRLTLSNGNQTVTSKGGYLPDSSEEYSTLVNIAGPVTSVSVVHEQIDGNDSGINITDIAFNPLETVNSIVEVGAGNDVLIGGKGDDSAEGGAGDDTIEGGDGDDTLKGGDGTDVLDGGEGKDHIFGGADADTILGGTDGDIIDGGAGGFSDDPLLNTDDDTLDLRGVGNFKIIDETPDGNGNGFNGTVVLLDADGNETGRFDYFEIENFLGRVEAPIANDDSATTDEDTPLSNIDVLGNDSDPDGDALALKVIAATAENGTVAINADGTLTYTPDADFNGEDTITYTIEDADGLTDEATVSVTVNPVNDDPVAVDDSATTDEQQPVKIDLIGNDTDVDGDALELVGFDQPANGVVTGNGDGTVTYTPNKGFSGDDTFSYTVGDGKGGTDTGTVTVTVNDTIRPDGIVTNGDEAALIDTAYDGDPNGDFIDNNDAILGNAGSNDDIVLAGGGNDTVLAGEGNDTVKGEDGDDSILGGAGDDSLSGDAGNDTIDGQSGADTIDGGDGDDSLVGGGQGDLIFGGAGNDTLRGGGGKDTLDGGDGDDSIRGGSEDDLILAGAGNDTVDSAGPGNDTVDGGAGDDELSGGAGDDSIDGGTGNDAIHGGDGNDTVNGGDGKDTIAGQDGDDVLLGGADDDSITGGNGSDFADGGDGADFIDTSGHDPSIDTDAPLVPTPFDQDPQPGNDKDTVLGGAGNDTILTGDDADFIDAGAGDDSIESGIDDDEVLGGDGNDTIIDIQGSDTILGGAGDDVINAGTNTFSDFANDQPTLPNGTPNPFAGVGDPNTGDGRDFVDGGDGNDTITTGDDADTILGGTGNDVIDAGIDNDEVSGGDGDDSIIGSHGADTLRGDAGADTIYGGFGPTPGIPGLIDEVVDADDPEPGNDTDLIIGGAGNDVLFGEDDDDTIYGGADDDYIDGGIDEDYLDGGDGNDTILGGQGDDTVVGGDGDDSIDGGDGDDLLSGDGGNDTIIGGGGNDTIDGGDGDDLLTGREGNDTILGGSGNDSLFGRSGDDLIDGGDGDDVISGGLDADTLLGGAGNDTISGRQGDDSISGGDGDDSIDAGGGRDTVDGGAGNDTIIGGTGDDTITGGTGNDRIDGFGGNDLLEGNDGDDTITGGSGKDTMLGGADQDTFFGVGPGDSIVGGNTGTDFDVIDLTGSLNGGSYKIVNLTDDDDPGDTDNTDGPNDGFDGEIRFFDADGKSTGTLTFENIEKIIPCFTPGTLIATPKGERRVEDLREGDRVITRDNGIQEIRWMGEKRLTRGELAKQPELKPVLIQAGSLGNGLPERDMLVSPNHRMLVANDKTALYFEEREVLVAAKHLTGGAGIDQVQALGVSYIHFMFEQHEVVLSDGTWSESFQPGDYTLKGIGDAQRDEILKLFPELEHHEGIEGYQSARRTLKRHEAKLLLK